MKSYREIARIHSRRCVASVIVSLSLAVFSLLAFLYGWIFTSALLWVAVMAAVVSCFHHAVEAGRNAQLSSYFDAWNDYKS